MTRNEVVALVKGIKPSLNGRQGQIIHMPPTHVDAPPPADVTVQNHNHVEPTPIYNEAPDLSPIAAVLGKLLEHMAASEERMTALLRDNTEALRGLVTAVENLPIPAQPKAPQVTVQVGEELLGMVGEVVESATRAAVSSLQKVPAVVSPPKPIGKRSFTIKHSDGSRSTVEEG